MYYNEDKEQGFLAGAVFFCGGTLVLDISDNDRTYNHPIKVETALV
jgi:multisubunit Na+/H+ antiporter MnhE subunit